MVRGRAAANHPARRQAGGRTVDGEDDLKGLSRLSAPARCYCRPLKVCCAGPAADPRSHNYYGF